MSRQKGDIKVANREAHRARVELQRLVLQALKSDGAMDSISLEAAVRRVVAAEEQLQVLVAAAAKKAFLKGMLGT